MYLPKGASTFPRIYLFYQIYCCSVCTYQKEQVPFLESIYFIRFIAAPYVPTKSSKYLSSNLFILSDLLLLRMYLPKGASTFPRIYLFYQIYCCSVCTYQKQQVPFLESIYFIRFIAALALKFCTQNFYDIHCIFLRAEDHFYSVCCMLDITVGLIQMHNRNIESKKVKMYYIY